MNFQEFREFVYFRVRPHFPDCTNILTQPTRDNYGEAAIVTLNCSGKGVAIVTLDYRDGDTSRMISEIARQYEIVFGVRSPSYVPAEGTVSNPSRELWGIVDGRPIRTDLYDSFQYMNETLDNLFEKHIKIEEPKEILPKRRIRTDRK